MKGIILRVGFFGAMIILLGTLLASHAEAGKYKGSLIHSPSEIAEVVDYSNSFGYLYQPGVFAAFEAANPDMHTIVTISGYLRDPVTGVFGTDVSELIAEVNQYKTGDHDVIFLIDEPAWLTRLECEYYGKPEACHEVDTNFYQTMLNLESVAMQLRAQVPGALIWHNVAYDEIIAMVKKQGRIDMIRNADFYSYDCYGIMNACGDTKRGYHDQALYGNYVYQEMMRHEREELAGRRMLLIAGAYHTNGFPNQYAILSQLESYRIYHEADFVAGTAIFYRGGYRGMSKVEEYLSTNYKFWQ